MIRITVSGPGIHDRVAAISRWANNVDDRTRQNFSAGRHAGPKDGDIWSAVKPVFLKIQQGKCCYCERRPGEHGIEWAVEHYRPKGRVKSWLPPASLKFRFKDKAVRGGYYLLAYDPLNYLAVCHTCNSIFKAEYFPVLRRRQMKTNDMAKLAGEQPLLINPIHDAEDPEELIDFLGPTPQPRIKEGPAYKRARATIEMLGLARGDLMLERSKILISLWEFWASGKYNLVDLWCRAGMEHAGCSRAFRRLCQSDPAAAKAIYDRALVMVEKSMLDSS
ncbi:MAG TPA: hypothetical protein VGL63_16660 [Streptosporangiaceae bacterium]|jgi:hypothetical protein